MAKIDMGLMTIAGIMYNGLDRKEACDRYLEAFPKDQYSEYLHVVVGDDNVDDYFIFSSISTIAKAICDDEENTELRRQFNFLVGLLKLPLPDWWEDED